MELAFSRAAALRKNELYGGKRKTTQENPPIRSLRVIRQGNADVANVATHQYGINIKNKKMLRLDCGWIVILDTKGLVHAFEA